MSDTKENRALMHVLPAAVRAQIMGIFAEEGEELIGSIERSLDTLLVHEGVERERVWHDIQRALHTLKGSCAAAGATLAKAATHALEERVLTLAARSDALSQHEAAELF